MKVIRCTEREASIGGAPRITICPLFAVKSIPLPIRPIFPVVSTVILDPTPSVSDLTSSAISCFDSAVLIT
jgi:hypothetical protein